MITRPITPKTALITKKEKKMNIVIRSIGLEDKKQINNRMITPSISKLISNSKKLLENLNRNPVKVINISEEKTRSIKVNLNNQQGGYN